MPTVSVEMSPVEFPIMNCTGTLAPGDLVELTKTSSPTLKGRVFEVKNKKYGRDGEDGLGVKIGITEGRLSELTGQSPLAGYTVTKPSTGVTGTVRTPFMSRYRAKLMKPTELQKMLDMGLELIKRAATIKKSDYALQWFGSTAYEADELAKINRRCAELRNGCDGLTSVIFQCAASETLGAIDQADPLRHGPSARIKLGRGFTYDRYSWGEQVCTIVHELTHWFLDTVDESQDGEDCYGLNCIKLAKHTSKTVRAKALNNADNWAYYICQYRTSGDPGDWRFFTANEIEQRGPFVAGGYNVVSSLISTYG
jgi:hypothetical protein